MNAATETTPIERNAELPTWFGVGGRADALARPASVEAVADLVRTHEHIRVLGDGANLLVDDEGVDGLVLSLEHLNSAEFLEDSTVRVGAGVKLPALILESIRRGFAGLEGFAGIPATLGGAIAMNAGGAWGQIADVIRAVRVVDHEGGIHTTARDEIGFGYRRSGLVGSIIVSADLALKPGDPSALRDRLKEVMAYKKNTQPMADRSAGCVFKNPVVAGERVSAGALIDHSGCKGLRVGSAHVSELHANFILIDPGGTARDAIELMDAVEQRVRDAQGITLEREVVIWRRGR
jgi:UDP-N-acetylmuramate dehydrogenase